MSLSFENERSALAMVTGMTRNRTQSLCSCGNEEFKWRSCRISSKSLILSIADISDLNSLEKQRSSNFKSSPEKSSEYESTKRSTDSSMSFEDAARSLEPHLMSSFIY